MRAKDTVGISLDLKMVQHELTQALEAALGQLGLTLPQYTALACLEEGTLTTNAELARKSSVTPQTMNRILHNLKRDGFVTCTPQAEHGLKQDYELTAKAVRVLCDAHTEVNAVECRLIRGMAKPALKDFRAQLERCRANLRDEISGGEKVK